MLLPSEKEQLLDISRTATLHHYMAEYNYLVRVTDVTYFKTKLFNTMKVKPKNQEIFWKLFKKECYLKKYGIAL